MGFGGFLKKAAGFALPLVGTALGGPLGGAAGALAGRLINRGGGQPQQQAAAPMQAQATGNPNQVQQDTDTFRGMTQDEAGRAKQMSGAYQQGITGFDPQQYATQAAAGQAKQFGQMARSMETDRRVSAQGRGFLGSPMGQGRQMKDLNNRIATQIASNSQQAGGQRLQQLGNMGSYAQGANQNAMEAQGDIMNSGRAQQQQDQANKINQGNAKKSMWGNIGGALLGTAGTVLAGYLGRPKTAAA